MRAISSGVGVRPSEGVDEPRRGPPPLGQQLHHVGRDADRFAGVDQRPLDRLLDPIARIGAEAGADLGVEALHGPQQAKVALLDQVGQRQPAVGVAAGDADHQPQVGPHHVVAGQGVAAGDRLGEPLLVGGREQGGLIDVAQIGFERILHGGCGGLAMRRWHGATTVLRMAVLAGRAAERPHGCRIVPAQA
jgi:hypothetical protein